VKVADFGLARAYEASPLSGLTLTGMSGGTPPFMPPEQVLDMRNVKPAADQYSAAATLYRLLTGHHVFPPSASVQELFTRILQSEPTPIGTHRPDLPASLAAAIHRALARDPAARFADCRAFAAALKPFAG
jgi:eukaryotic-like serine/threonine-protein kinase